MIYKPITTTHPEWQVEPHPCECRHDWHTGRCTECDCETSCKNLAR